MKFKEIAAVDTYEDAIIYWADLLDMPEAVQDEARKIDGEECKGQRFGVCVSYNFAGKDFFIFADKAPPVPLCDGNIYYIDTDDDFHWLQVKIRDEIADLTKQIFNACDRINTGIDTPQGYTIQKTVQFRDGTGLVLAKKDDIKYPFINWMFNQTPQGYRKYTWGHCHADEKTAEKAFANAIAAHTQYERADCSSPAKATARDTGKKPSILDQLAAKPVPSDQPTTKPKDREVR